MYKLIEHDGIDYLSGYLYGLTSSDGNLNDFYAGVAFFETRDSLTSIKKIFALSEANECLIVNESLRYVYLEYYLEHILYITPCGNLKIYDEKIVEKRKYHSFKIIDFLEMNFLDEIDSEKQLTIYQVVEQEEIFFVFNIEFENKNIAILFRSNKIYFPNLDNFSLWRPNISCSIDDAKANIMKGKR
jgi:hypothetical protein